MLEIFSSILKRIYNGRRQLDAFCMQQSSHDESSFKRRMQVNYSLRQPLREEGDVPRTVLGRALALRLYRFNLTRMNI
jgi:hypothetical protein